VTSTPSSVTRWKIFPPNCSNFFTICRRHRCQHQQVPVTSECQQHAQELTAHRRWLEPGKGAPASLQLVHVLKRMHWPSNSNKYMPSTALYMSDPLQHSSTPSPPSDCTPTHLSNEQVWAHPQVEHVLRPHILAAIEPHPHRVELHGYDLCQVRGGQQAQLRQIKVNGWAGDRLVEG
jgi:hypothetical protein